MPVSKEEVKQKLSELIDKHQRFKNEGRLKGINEETTKQWIDELFQILGWVFIEDVVKEYGTGKRKRVDYAFRIGGTVKFLLEAKAYGEDLEEKYVKQILEYGYWNNKTWVVLTNFREIRVYNAKYYDKEEHIRRLYEPIKIEDIVARFDDLWVLSYDGMRENLINKLATKYGKVKPKEPIDTRIFEDLLRWRKLLEKGIRAEEKFNRIPIDPQKAEEYIDEAVQKILDRIIFVRVCEDRGFEDEDQLRWCITKWKEDEKVRLFNWLNREFSKKDNEYDSGLFHPHYSQNLTIDDEILKQIIEESYASPGKLPYDFSAIDADILGTIYENYLAYIQQRVWHKASKQKSKRKAHGIYYTPMYIVDHIVKNTLGEKLKNCKTSEDALNIKVLDPACGSGSFLIRVYDEFKNWYIIHLKKNREKMELTKDDLEKISEFMNKILQNCIYGVDLDPKAVELTQLNLLLKAAEGKHKLPPLNHTIKCGNSLIDDSVIAGKHAFKWEEKFPEVFRDGGFSVVIGNPPYGATFNTEEKSYFDEKYTYVKSVYESYRLFIEQAIKLAKKEGHIGLIVPNTWFYLTNAEYMRKDLLTKLAIVNLVNLPQSVFEAATVDTCIIILKKVVIKNNQIYAFFFSYKDKIINLDLLTYKLIQQNDLLNSPAHVINLKLNIQDIPLISKIKNQPKILNNYVKIITGIKPYQIGKGVPPQTKNIVDEKPYTLSSQKDATFKPWLTGKFISRYKVIKNKEYIQYGKWLAEPKTPDIFESDRIGLQQIRNPSLPRRIVAAFIDGGTYTNNGIHNLLSKDKDQLFWVLGILNSKLMNFYFAAHYNDVNIKPSNLYNLPYPEYTPKSKISSLVKKIISLNKQIDDITNQNSNEAQNIKAEIEKTDAEIDHLVYELYGLTEEEIKIVEDSLK